MGLLGVAVILLVFVVVCVGLTLFPAPERHDLPPPDDQKKTRKKLKAKENDPPSNKSAEP